MPKIEMGDEISPAARAGPFLVEFGTAVVALADLRKIPRDHPLGHPHAVVGHAQEVLTRRLIMPPGDGDAQLLEPAVHVRAGPPARAAVLPWRDLQPEFAQFQGVEGVLEQLADAEPGVAVQRLAHEQLLDLVLIQPELEVAVGVDRACRQPAGLMSSVAAWGRWMPYRSPRSPRRRRCQCSSSRTERISASIQEPKSRMLFSKTGWRTGWRSTSAGARRPRASPGSSR